MQRSTRRDRFEARTRAAALAVAMAAMSPACTDKLNPHVGPAMNYHRIDDHLATSGHFVGDGMQTLVAGGLEVVIELREEPPEDNARRLADAGVKYLHVPVSWEEPTVEQFEAFGDALSAHRKQNVLVQCAANYRASAMTYLYRVHAENVAKDRAAADLRVVWEPNRTWRRYFDNVGPP